MQRAEILGRLSPFLQRAALCITACVLAGFTWGCAGTAHSSSTTVPQTPAAQTFGISGSLSPTTGGSGAVVTLSGASTATTSANSAGAYSFSGLPAGTYAVTPSNTGFTFSPTTQSATITTANITGLNFTATASTGQTHSVALTWTASTSTVSGYNIYRSTVSGSGYAKLNSSLVASLSYSDTTVQSGTTYFYVATAVDSGGDESADSNQATAVIP
jgi:hypothetical protein